MDASTWERRRRTFENTADSYDRFRPSYPDDLFATLASYAALAPGERILEIGGGTGQATAHLERWGNPVLVLEPSAAMVDVAKPKLDGRRVRWEIMTFEGWTVEPDAFGLIVSAQAFHWLDPATKHARCAYALKSGGTLALIWNTQVNPDETRPFFERVQEVYREHAPALTHEGEFSAEVRDNAEFEAMRVSGHFDDFALYRQPWQWTLDRDSYLGLMSSHSPHAALPDDQRLRLLDAIGNLIDMEFGGRVTEHYVAELFCGRKR